VPALEIASIDEHPNCAKRRPLSAPDDAPPPGGRRMRWALLSVIVIAALVVSVVLAVGGGGPTTQAATFTKDDLPRLVLPDKDAPGDLKLSAEHVAALLHTDPTPRRLRGRTPRRVPALATLPLPAGYWAGDVAAERGGRAKGERRV